MTTPSPENVADLMVTFVPEKVNGYACAVIGPPTSMQGYEVRFFTPGDSFAEKASAEIRSWISSALSERDTHIKCLAAEVERLDSIEPRSNAVVASLEYAKEISK